jgi:hypothetical protein
MTVTNFELFIKLHSLGVNAKILVAQGGEDGYGTSRRDGISGDLLYRKCKRYCRLGLFRIQICNQGREPIKIKSESFPKSAKHHET